MFWIVRKSLIPLGALAAGWVAHAEWMGERCTAAGGEVKGSICRGVDQ